MAVRTVTIDGNVVTEIEMRDVFQKRLILRANMPLAQAMNVASEITETIFDAWRGNS